MGHSVDEKIKTNPPKSAVEQIEVQQAGAGACSSSISTTQFRALSWSGWLGASHGWLVEVEDNSQLGNHHFQVSY